MASKTTLELLDDVNGKPAAETLAFGIDGTTYEIDLSEKNAKALRTALEPFVGVGRRTAGRLTRGNAKPVATGVDGIAVSARGRIPGAVIEKYRAAGN
jgi:Lsr2